MRRKFLFISKHFVKMRILLILAKIHPISAFKMRSNLLLSLKEKSFLWLFPTSLNISVYFSELTFHAILIWKLYFRVLRESSPIKHRGYWNKIKGVIWNLSFDFGGGCSEIKMAKIQKYELMAKKLLNPFFIYVSKGML